MVEEGKLGTRQLGEAGGWVGMVVESLLEGVQDVVERGRGGRVVGGC